MGDLTVLELKAMCEKVVVMREQIEKAKAVYSSLCNQGDLLEAELIDAMAKLDMRSFKEGGLNFIRTEKSSVTIPKGEAKDEFFDYLKKVGHFEALATVNSATLNSWYKSEDEAAKARGEPYAVIPGLEMPTIRVGLTVRKA